MTPAGMVAIPAEQLCPCCSALAYAACCGPLVAGEHLASTTEQLMRSRYTAYAVGALDHVWRSWHPATRPEQVTPDPTTTWVRLTVLRVDGGGEDEETGTVEFAARWRARSAGSPAGPAAGSTSTAWKPLQQKPPQISTDGMRSGA